MNYQRIKLEFQNKLAVLTLHHPEVLNAISLEMLEELKSAVTTISDPANDVRCLLITGAGRGFCSGANLTDPGRRRGGETDGPAAVNLDSTYNPLFLMLRNLGIPVITAVKGPAAGVGMSLALMGDIVLAGRSAYFLQAFRNIGLIPDGGITWLLPRLIGLRRAVELSMLAEKLPAEKALEWGLITRVVDDDDLMPEALKLAGDLVVGPTLALGLMRRAYWNSPDNTFEQQLHLESRGQDAAGRSEDFAEGVKAFFEKRKPGFRGR